MRKVSQAISDVVKIPEAANNYDFCFYTDEDVKNGKIDRKVVDVIKPRPEGQEIVLTGRNAPRDIVKLADLVTEMKEIKHYFSKGVKARAGIEK